MKNPPPSKAETIKLLRTTIQELETIVNKLNTQTADVVPPQDSLETLLSSTQQLAKAIKPAEGTKTTIQEEIIEPQPEIVAETPLTSSNKSKIITISGAIALVAVLIFFFWFRQPSQPPAEIAVNPPAEVSQPSPVNKEAPSPETPPISEPKSTPSPQPRLQLVPQQTLIASIQEQVANITNNYAEGLIQYIEADFLASRLIVYVGDDWYQLSLSEQQKIANEIFQQTRTLDFDKLEISDTIGTLLARSPVVGQDMVIFPRR